MKFEHLRVGVRKSTSTLEFKDARTTVACILRSFFRVVTPSARLLAQHASRRAAPRRAAPEYARRTRAYERSPRADGCLTSQRATSRRGLPSAAPSVCVCLGSRRLHCYVVLRRPLFRCTYMIEPSTIPPSNILRTVNIRSCYDQDR